MNLVHTSIYESKKIGLSQNNLKLSDQIKLCIISDYYPKTLSKLPKGVMEFFIRDGELAINYHNVKTGLREQPNALQGVGMTRKRLMTFLSLIEYKITQHPPIDYGTILINYELMDDGDVDGSIEFKTQVNHRRR
ncbi:hypothetical protein EHV15_35000 [Paenibacillus oralis]|uniref:Uncharacterized protein n=1 Tax=Paenibacillus oralis TaxID=2490856 RepID=A0A3P3TB98_9BACL|nr:hypothetical protein [Paenibacillus oralis]RRJ54799.1 hypothetical protein EHV15_35000 [Paenibacillus oralis]